MGLDSTSQWIFRPFPSQPPTEDNAEPSTPPSDALNHGTDIAVPDSQTQVRQDHEGHFPDLHLHSACFTHKMDSDIAEDVRTTTAHEDFADRAVLVQRILHTTVPEVQQQRSLHWKPRWLSETPIPDEDLSRITSFCIAFLPAGRFCLPELSVAQWRRTLLRFKPKAAKGADGFALSDLRNMTDQQVSFVLSLLTNIEKGKSQWPIQWLEGFVISYYYL